MTFTPDQYTGPSDFVHHHLHTTMSTLDGVASPEDYILECKRRKWTAIAATEHGNCASIPDMYLEANKHGIKNIAGCEIYYNDWEPARKNIENVRALKVENPHLYNRVVRNRHLTVLAKNEIGLENLLKLTTQAHKTGGFGLGRTKYPRVWFEKLCEFKEGLIILSGCLNGPVAHELRFTEIKDKDGSTLWARKFDECSHDAETYVRKFHEVFGDDYYMELQMPGVAQDELVFKWSVAKAKELGIKCVLTNDAHYIEQKDAYYQKVMMAISQGVTIDSPDLFYSNSDEQFFKTRAELWATFKNKSYSDGIPDSDFEEFCDNTLLVADRCDKMRVDPSPKTPQFPNADNQLRKIVAEALVAKGLHNDPKKYLIDGREVTAVDQAKIEIQRFIDKGFSSYFLITQDLIQYGRARGWPFTPRGSAGGSLVCYLLGIANFNPMKWGLSFDRFLSPSRGGYSLNTKMPTPNNKDK